MSNKYFTSYVVNKEMAVLIKKIWKNHEFIIKYILKNNLPTYY